MVEHFTDYESMVYFVEQMIDEITDQTLDSHLTIDIRYVNSGWQVKIDNLNDD